jgi:hypothetical protein
MMITAENLAAAQRMLIAPQFNPEALKILAQGKRRNDRTGSQDQRNGD